MFTIISKNYSNITLTIIVILACVSVVIFNHNRLLNHYIKKQINSAGIEGMTIPSLDFSPDTSFCNKYQRNPNSLEGACKKLTNENCKMSSCCVLVNGSKCSAGGASGPIYKTDDKGQPMQLDNYYYKNKCYGTKC